MRKRLSDITNTQSQPKPSNQEEKPQQIPPAAEDYINQLIKVFSYPGLVYFFIFFLLIV